MLPSKILFLVMLICDISGQLYLAYSCHGVNVYAYAVGVGVYAKGDSISQALTERIKCSSHSIVAISALGVR